MQSTEGQPAILLVNPRICRERSVRLPLSLLNLAAVLEGRYPWRILDGNIQEIESAAINALSARRHALVGITVMPGPQVATAISISAKIRRVHPNVPIVWGGYFPTLYPQSALNAEYVDYLVRGQGEGTLLSLLDVLTSGPLSAGIDSEPIRADLEQVLGLSWKSRGRQVHNPERPLIAPASLPQLPYRGLDSVKPYLRRTFLGARTAAHQIALGCRYHCEFCGVVSMWNGRTVGDEPTHLEVTLDTLRDEHGADSVQFFDHNFFDREDSAIPILRVLQKAKLPWWCYARADTLARFSTNTWEMIRQSGLRMAYIGAEAASDAVLIGMKKGSRVDHTLETAARCRSYGVIPEFSFVLGGPDDPEGEIEKTFAFIRRLKATHPTCEIVLYFYSPTPQVDRRARKRQPGEPHLPVLHHYGPEGPPVPDTPEGWAEPRWVRWVCHQDAPWLTPRLRRRVNDFSQVIACRFPTIQDYHTRPWQKSVLRAFSRWRYATGIYGVPLELSLGRRLFSVREPSSESL